jgi:eukaryotic-like serine/threonine-protein kinase
MLGPEPFQGSVRFEGFELDLRAGELRSASGGNDGKTVRLAEQPFLILTMLLERPGQVVTREEIRKRLWPNDTIVEFEHSISAAMNRLRQALGDSADNPRYIETLARRGYRWMVPVESVAAAPAGPPVVAAPALTAPEPKPSTSGLIGKTVSHYRVLGIVGSGGMGVVYRAEDIRLGRQVALKFLPEDVAGNPQALERFEREARAASTLNHPNICTIHEVEEHKGKPFIVMELLEGQTLRERLAARSVSGPGGPGSTLPIDELLALGIQIADGLEAAHYKGIIHRDIKPANIFITTDGQAKILDFGLAKLTALASSRSPRTEDAPASDSGKQPNGHDTPTAAFETCHLTRPDAMMGTAAYMSPEQIRCEKVDARTDLFSFGLVLYEMATGRQAFSGATTGVIHEAILNRAATPLTSLNPKLPPKLEEIVNKALEKDCDLRYHSAGDLGADLKRLKRETDLGRDRAAVLPVAPSNGGVAAVPSSTGPAAGPAALGHGPGVRLWRWRLWLAGSLATITIVLMGAWFLFLRRPPRQPAELTQKRLTFNSSENPVTHQEISPDGKYLAYSDSAGIHVKLLSTSEDRLISRPAGVPADAQWRSESWFPDGTQLLASTEDAGGHAGMWIVSVMGQSARELREDGVGLGVSPDGTRIAFLPKTAGSGYVSEVWVMDSQGDNPQKVLAFAKDEWFYDGWFNNVHWSPDGQRLAYMRMRHTPDRVLVKSMEACDLKGANCTLVLRDTDLGNMDVEDYCWLPDGRIVYSGQSPGSDSTNLWQISIDSHSGTPTGKPKRITQWPASVTGQLSASADGKRLTVTQQTYREQVYVGTLAAAGTRMSPPRRLVNDEASDKPYNWTGDSKAVLFSSQRNGTWGIFKQGINQDTAEPMVTGPQNANYPILSADGAWILYEEYSENWEPSTPILLMRTPVSGGVPQRVMELRSDSDYKCARAPASLRTILETSQDEKRFTLTAFDPLNGRGKVLRTIQKDPNVGVYGGTLSPDGTVSAISDGGESEIHIRLLSLSGGTDREFTVKGWRNLTGLDWSADGKGLYVGCVSPQARTLLYVDLKGNPRVLWQYKGSGQDIWGSPSPDGRYLAILGEASNSNVWMLENF